MSVVDLSSPNKIDGKYSGGDIAGLIAGFMNQKLDDIQQDALSSYLDSSDYALEEKKNGDRQVLMISRENVSSITDLGLRVDTPYQLVQEAKNLASFHRMSGSSVIDGVLDGDSFYAFDLIVFNGKDIRHLPFVERSELLDYIITQQSDALGLSFLHKVQTYFSASDKRGAVERLQAENGECVFKSVNAQYSSDVGPVSVTQFRFKFESVSADNARDCDDIASPAKVKRFG